ncbi:hypothetical protein C8Q79DRAFT_645364 [Trametes meyenii]|nr:hypothetical protein C8Q79DRAFT_645364 [Trametes meyenii]
MRDQTRSHPRTGNPFYAKDYGACPTTESPKANDVPHGVHLQPSPGRSPVYAIDRGLPSNVSQPKLPGMEAHRWPRSPPAAMPRPLVACSSMPLAAVLPAISSLGLTGRRSGTFPLSLRSGLAPPPIACMGTEASLICIH